MPLDGAMLSQIKTEIEALGVGSRVDKIHQPSREELIISLRGKQGGLKLLLSVGANSPRLHFTQCQPENPKSPPMFCMLMRKLLSSAQLLSIEQQGLDRILQMKFEATDELGDKVILILCMEIMGRHSNLIIMRENGKIIDSIKRIDITMSSVRPILPGVIYTLPPADDSKLNMLNVTAQEIIAHLKSQPREIELSKRLLECLQGTSPLLCREIAQFVTRGVSKTVFELSNDELIRLKFHLETLVENMKNGSCPPTMLVDKSGKPKDFTFIDIKQYGVELYTRQFETYSALLDSFYSERDGMDRMRQRSGDLLRLVVNTSDRISRRLETQRQELMQSEDRGKFKIFGDLISTNMYSMQRGDRIARVQNYYDEALPTVEIPLDIRLTPNQNAQKYYNEYRKLDTAEKKLHEQIAQGEGELQYIDSVFDALTRSRTEGELAAIKFELAQEGYLKNYQLKGRKEEKLPHHKFLSSDGFTILVGRNNVQNDKLTIKESKNTDIWFHVQKIPGSHTIVVTDGKDVPNSTLEEACKLAAYHSKARDSSKVPVDYTPVKYVKKPNGAKPGMVVYDVYKTAIVDPDKELVDSLRQTSK